MKRLYGLISVVSILCIAFSASAQESRVVVVHAGSKELKRSAHRLRIPVDQLKNARQTLQEATDLARKIKPYPMMQVYSLANSWQQLNRTKMKTVVDSFIQDLRSEAAQAADPQTYMQATTTAMSLMQSNAELDYEKLQQALRRWPDPPDSIAESTRKFRESLEENARQSSLWQMSNTDPEKALELISQTGESGEYNYPISAQIAQGFMNAGKNDEAFDVIDRTIADFSRHAADPRAVQSYESFVQMSLWQLDSSRAAAVIDPWIAQLTNPDSPADCSGTLSAGNTSVDLTCAQSKVLNLVRSLPTKPSLVQKTLDSIPGLRSKVDSIGGIDNLYSNSGMSFTMGSKAGRHPVISAPMMPGNPSKLFQELKGKARSNPGYVKAKLQEVAESRQGVETLINLAAMASYQEDELASLALEAAQEFIPRIEPLPIRSNILQQLIRAYRQVEGEVDQGLLQNGFVLADQLRQEQSEKNGFSDEMNSTTRQEYAPADQFEAFLVSELSRDSFDSAINYVRSMKDGDFKLQCLIQIVQALSQPNF